MNDKQKISVTAQKQLPCQLDGHQMLTYTVSSVNKWNMLDQELEFFFLFYHLEVKMYYFW